MQAARTKARNRGGREARRAARTAPSFTMLPGLKRGLPLCEPLDEEQVRRIDDASMAILEEVLEQRNIPPEEIVRCPMREIPNLRMAAAKFAKDNEFTIRNVVDIERRLSATLSYMDDEGELRERTLTGQLDVLTVDAGHDRGVIVIDWKDTWGHTVEHFTDGDLVNARFEAGSHDPGVALGTQWGRFA